MSTSFAGPSFACGLRARAMSYYSPKRHTDAGGQDVRHVEPNHDEPGILGTAKLPKPTPVFDAYWRFAAERQDIFRHRLSSSHQQTCAYLEDRRIGPGPSGIPVRVAHDDLAGRLIAVETGSRGHIKRLQEDIDADEYEQQGGHAGKPAGSVRGHDCLPPFPGFLGRAARAARPTSSRNLYSFRSIRNLLPDGISPATRATAALAAIEAALVQANLDYLDHRYQPAIEGYQRAERLVFAQLYPLAGPTGPVSRNPQLFGPLLSIGAEWLNVLPVVIPNTAVRPRDPIDPQIIGDAGASLGLILWRTR
jgi:hypothetical protein